MNAELPPPVPPVPFAAAVAATLAAVGLPPGPPAGPAARATPSPPRDDRPRPLRSVVAVLAGVVANGVLASAVDAALHAAGVYPPAGEVMSGPLFVLAASYRCVFQVAAGALTARLAPRRPDAHVAVLAGLGVALSAVGVAVAVAGGPAFGPLAYPIALLVLAAPTTWLGGRLAVRHAARQPPPA